MKKITIMFFVIFIFFSCKKDDNCDCDRITDKTKFSNVDYYYVYTKNDCTGEEKKHLDVSTIEPVIGDCYIVDSSSFYNNNNTNNNVTTTIEIGSIYQGGRVFYLDGNGGGKVVGTYEDLYLNLIDWYEATDLCANSTFNGYSDWYLPSLNELKLIRDSLMLNGFSTTNTSWTDGKLWSSTDIPFPDPQFPEVWAFNMTTGDSIITEKQADWTNCSVLSVREF